MDKQEGNYKIYLDVCCLNRPFDDWKQERIRLEGEAVLSIMERIRNKKWQLVTSEAIRVELEKMRNLDKLENILNLLQLAVISVKIDEQVDFRSQQLENLGFLVFMIRFILLVQKSLKLISYSLLMTVY